MSFKTSHSTKKKPGRWSTKGKRASQVYSCPNCFTRHEDPPRKLSDNQPYCSRCFAHKSEIIELKLIKVYKPPGRSGRR